MCLGVMNLIFSGLGVIQLGENQVGSIESADSKILRSEDAAGLEIAF